MAIQYCKIALISEKSLEFSPSELAAGAYTLALEKQMTSQESLTALIAKINF
jgi:hypothetical protein